MQKRSYATQVVIALVSIIIMLPGIAFGNTGGETVPLETQFDNSINITVDPRIELLSVVQYLSDYKGYQGMQMITSFSFTYKNDVIAYFEPYKDHEAVKLFKEMSSNGFWYGQPPHSMLYLSAPPELRVLTPVDAFNVERAGGQEKLEEFFGQLRSFAVETDFMNFYNSQREAH